MNVWKSKRIEFVWSRRKGDQGLKCLSNVGRGRVLYSNLPYISSVEHFSLTSFLKLLYPHHNRKILPSANSTVSCKLVCQGTAGQSKLEVSCDKVWGKWQCCKWKSWHLYMSKATPFLFIFLRVALFFLLVFLSIGFEILKWENTLKCCLALPCCFIILHEHFLVLSLDFFLYLI